MKLYVAAAIVALARQASAFRIILDNDDTYCVEIIKYDSSHEHTFNTVTGAITAAPTGAETDGNDASTVARNGKNDPTGNILTAAQAAWNSGNGVAGSTATVFYPGSTSAATGTLSPDPTTQTTITWCDMYSTLAPEHYCKGDGDYESWQESTISTDIADCCTDNHGSMYNECFTTTAGIAPPGSGDWYADYENGKCVRDCTSENYYTDDGNSATYHAFADSSQTSPVTTYECGGFPSWSGVTEYTDVGDCCETVFTSIVKEYCEYLSTTGSSSSPGTYPGRADQAGSNPTKFWYADTANGICVQDCAVDSSYPRCGGVITAASIPTYDTAESCCDASISWDASGCETRSLAGEGEPTLSYWASPEGCRQDCTGDVNCASAPSTARLYATATECCQNANAWVNQEYCETRAVSDWNTNTGTGTNNFYVDYEDGACRKDCTDTTTANSPCEVAESGSLSFFTSAESCCKATLAYVDEAACIEASSTGASISTVATDKWYVVPGSDQLCAKDCATGGGDAACGGIVAKSGVRMYDTAEECCEQAYNWVNQDLCAALSYNADAPTNLWYVDYSANICKQDCTVASSAPNPTSPADCIEPTGRPDDTSITMYETAEACCKARLSWTDSDTCVTASETGVDPTSADSPGTGKWRKNDSWSYCVLDCTAGDIIGTDDGILDVDPLEDSAFRTTTALSAGNSYPDQCDGISSDSSGAQYDTVSACCDSVSWVQEETCSSLTTGEDSLMYFLDPSDGTKCVYHAAAASSEVDCSGSGTTIAVAGTPSNAIAGVTCEADITVSTRLYSTLDDCCDAHVSWDKENCVTTSQGGSAQGTRKFYVDWSISKCVQDCPESSASGDESCKGVANRWDTLYDTDTACCNRLNWIKRRDCIYTA